MSFELPNLDRKTWQQLVLEMMRRIPQYTALWTDYNDSDPGITLLQMLAWLDESLLYQANAIPLQTQQNFLRQILGLAFSKNQTAYSKAAQTDHDYDFLALQQMLANLESGTAYSATDLQKAVLTYTHLPYMGLTLENVNAIALQTNLLIQQQNDANALLVKRCYAQMRAEQIIAYILSSANWQYQYPDYPNKTQYQNNPNIKRKLLMVQATDQKAALNTLLKQVRTHLAPRVLAGNQILVYGVQWTDINLKMEITCAANTNLQVILTLLVARLFRFFLPCEGGPAGQGWDYGSAPQADDIRQQALEVAGVNAITVFVYNYIPTMRLDYMATLDVDTQLADVPLLPSKDTTGPGVEGGSALYYQGLPRLRCLDITVRSANA